jgi:hypothetical protein
VYENRGEFHVRLVDGKSIDQVRSQIATRALTIQVKPYAIANSGPTTIRTLRTQKNPGQTNVA